jgi:hypothetical protein
VNPLLITVANQLRTTRLFSSVGVKQQDAVHHLQSWEEAHAWATRSEWEVLLDEEDERVKRLTNELDASQRTARDAEVHKHYRLLLADTFFFAIPDRLIRQELEPVIVGNLHSMLYEAEYADLCPPGFVTTTLLPWYLRGHFPCGWKWPCHRVGSWYFNLSCQKTMPPNRLWQKAGLVHGEGQSSPAARCGAWPCRAAIPLPLEPGSPSWMLYLTTHGKPSIRRPSNDRDGIEHFVDYVPIRG